MFVPFQMFILYSNKNGGNIQFALVCRPATDLSTPGTKPQLRVYVMKSVPWPTVTLVMMLTPSHLHPARDSRSANFAFVDFRILTPVLVSPLHLPWTADMANFRVASVQKVVPVNQFVALIGNPLSIKGLVASDALVLNHHLITKEKGLSLIRLRFPMPIVSLQ
jgi:hypothetical protein